MSPSFFLEVRPFLPTEHLKLNSSNLSVSLFFSIINLFLEVMSSTKIILYDCLDIYKILNELSDILSFDIVHVDNKKEFDNLVKNLDSFLIISKKKTNFSNQIILNNLPIKVNKLIEKINLGILKMNYSLKSNIKIGKYLLNLNSREIFSEKIKLKLTEQEVKILVYLNDSRGNIKVEQLQKDIWKYNSDLETHTVETHIHRLRKKFLKMFNDKNFIKSSKEGYLIC